MKDKHREYCKTCGGELEMLDSKGGDPEGIRRDRICTNCGQKWGCSKAMFFKIS